MDAESENTDCPGLEEYFSFDLHNELGKAAFEAFQAGEIVEHAVFADRMQAENVIEQLQAEIQTDDSSAPGLVAAMKAKAKRAATYVKIQKERFPLKGLETDIGRRLIEANEEEDVRCEGTADQRCCRGHRMAGRCSVIHCCMTVDSVVCTSMGTSR